MQPYLDAPMNRFRQSWAVDVFHRAPSMHGIQNAEMKKKKKKLEVFVMSSLLYFIQNSGYLFFVFLFCFSNFKKYIYISEHI